MKFYFSWALPQGSGFIRCFLFQVIEVMNINIPLFAPSLGQGA